MPPPKSDKMLASQAERSNQREVAAPEPTKVYQSGEVVPIKKVECYNDFVAILQFQIESSVLLAGSAGFKNEGMVVGVGPGLPGPGGQRTPSQLTLGKVVSFYGNPVTTLEPKAGVYAGQKIIIVPERSVICGLKPVPFKIVDDDQGQS